MPSLYTCVMWSGMALDSFTPDERVAVAVAPFVLGLLLRQLLGRTQFTRCGTAFGTMWFTINVLLAPYSAGVRQELIDLGSSFR